MELVQLSHRDATAKSIKPSSIDVDYKGCQTRTTKLLYDYAKSLNEHKKETGIVDYDDTNNDDVKNEKSSF